MYKLKSAQDWLDERGGPEDLFSLQDIKEIQQNTIDFMLKLVESSADYEIAQKYATDFEEFKNRLLIDLKRKSQVL